jgi:hypothetical protein
VGFCTQRPLQYTYVLKRWKDGVEASNKKTGKYKIRWLLLIARRPDDSRVSFSPNHFAIYRNKTGTARDCQQRNKNEVLNGLLGQWPLGEFKTQRLLFIWQADVDPHGRVAEMEAQREKGNLKGISNCRSVWEPPLQSTVLSDDICAWSISHSRSFPILPYSQAVSLTVTPVEWRARGIKVSIAGKEWKCGR